MNETTRKIKGIGATVRHNGWTYRATVRHLGGGGTVYERFNGVWQVWLYDSIPPAAYRALRKELNRWIKNALVSAPI